MSQTLSKDDITALAQTVVALQQAQVATAPEPDEYVTFVPGQKPTKLDQDTLCRSALAGRGCERFVSEEESAAWQRGEPMSRHQLGFRPQIIHYNATKARERAKNGENKVCPNCGLTR